MKNKSIIGAIVALLVASMVVVGCNLNESQIKVIAQNAGLGAVVTWIAYDNPNAVTKQLVSDALDVVKSNLTSVESGKTYTETLYLVIEQFARGEQVPDQYEPLVLAGGLATLNGIDLLFATNPEWKEKEVLAIGIVNSFILGSKMGLSLDDTDERIQQARKFSTMRRRVFVE
jgi:hypothetical protein